MPLNFIIIGATLKGAPVIKNVLLFLFQLDSFKFCIWQKWIKPFSGPQFQKQAADIMLQSSYTESQTERENAVYDICRLQAT